MRKFMIRISLTVLGAMCLVIAADGFYRKVNPIDMDIPYDNLGCENMPDTITYVNTGSSHGQLSFRYSVMGQEVYSEAFNFGRTSQSLVYDKMWIDYYSKHFDSNQGVAFLTVSYFSLYEDETKEDNFTSKNQRYYPYLDREHMRLWNWKDSLLYGHLYYRLPILKMAEQEIGEIFVKPDEGQGIVKDTISIPTVNSINQKALEWMIDFFQSNNYRVVLVTTPVRPDYIEQYSQEYIEQFYSDLHDIQDKYCIEYIDASNWYEKRMDLFIDEHHLSEEGAADFTKRIFRQMGLSMNRD